LLFEGELDCHEKAHIQQSASIHAKISMLVVRRCAYLDI